MNCDDFLPHLATGAWFRRLRASARPPLSALCGCRFMAAGTESGARDDDRAGAFATNVAGCRICRSSTFGGISLWPPDASACALRLLGSRSPLCALFCWSAPLGYGRPKRTLTGRQARR